MARVLVFTDPFMGVLLMNDFLHSICCANGYSSMLKA
jgi:hypothetical protein